MLNAAAIRETRETLLAACREPRAMLRLDAAAWDWFLPAARQAGVVHRLAAQAVDRGLVDALPRPVRWHLEAAAAAAAHNRRTIAWELDRLARVLAPLGCPLVLLKGAAYVAAGLPPAAGRVAADVDLLVPAGDLDRVEHRLLESGWQAGDTPPRDAAYFRRWLHELPPLVHGYRKTTLDLHHNILPRTDRLAFDPARLLSVDSCLLTVDSQKRPADARLLSTVNCQPSTAFRVLAPPDMLLHSLVHLFRNGDFTHGLRDLADADDLARHFAADPAFWPRLVDRVRDLRLEAPVRLALRTLTRTLGTPVPEDVLARLAPRRGPAARLAARPADALADRLVERALFPSRLDGDDARRRRAQWLLAHVPLPRLRAVVSPLFWLKRLPARAS